MKENLVLLPLGLFFFGVSFSNSYNRINQVSRLLQENGWDTFPEMQQGDRLFFTTKSDTHTVYTSMLVLSAQDREEMDMVIMLPESEPERLGLVHDGIIPVLYTHVGFAVNPDDPVAEAWAELYAAEQPAPPPLVEHPDLDLTDKTAEEFVPARQIQREGLWRIDHVLPSEELSAEVNSRLPESHTHGLERFGLTNIAIRFLPAEVAGWVLNTVAAYVYKHGKDSLKPGMIVRIGSIDHVLVAEQDACDEPALRMSWYKDPAN